VKRNGKNIRTLSERKTTAGANDAATLVSQMAQQDAPESDVY
jgi:hypothetical protein